MFCIYGLIDPITTELKYIGFSTNHKRRYKTHLLPSSLKSKTKKNSWIKSLLSIDLKPELIILEEVSSEKDGFEKEIELIEYYRYIGCDLVNGTPGGDGRTGFSTPEDVKKKISQSMLGKNTKPKIYSQCQYCNKDFEYFAKYKTRNIRFCSLSCGNKARYASLCFG